MGRPGAGRSARRAWQAEDNRQRQQAELTSNAVLALSSDVDTEWHYIAPDKSSHNGFVERFNDCMRDELPNKTLFFGRTRRWITPPRLRSLSDSNSKGVVNPARCFTYAHARRHGRSLVDTQLNIRGPYSAPTVIVTFGLN